MLSDQYVWQVLGVVWNGLSARTTPCKCNSLDSRVVPLSRLPSISGMAIPAVAPVQLRSSLDTAWTPPSLPPFRPVLDANAVSDRSLPYLQLS